MIDPYQTLGIPRTATPDEAKQAYRRMARKYHPDVSKEPNAEERFKEIQAAWESIKNPRAQWQSTSSRPGGEWTQQDFEEIFRGFGGAWNHSPGARVEKVVSISITLENAFIGGTHNISGLRVQLPPGVRTGTRVRLDSELSVSVTVLPHRRFQRNNDDLLLTTHVGIADAVLGCEVQVKTISGSVLQIKIPGGIQNGQTVRLRGQGMPNPANTSHRGDLFLQVFVDTPDPSNLTEQQRQFLETNFNYQRTRDA